ncbi:MAG: carbon-nitrogen hydrolase family protein [Planctomycetota bacterium]|nr:carbon-nitrogen hydrolase family protein [Planctomycetota bacterium]
MAESKKASERLNIALAHPMAVPGDIDENIRRMEPMVAQGAAQGADLVLFSECGITGYDLNKVAFNAAMDLDDPRFKLVDAMAKRHNVPILNGFYERRGDRVGNSAFVFYPDGKRLLQRKHNMVGYETGPVKVLAGDRKREIFEIKGFKLAILICADGGIPNIEEELAAQGVDCILAPTAGCGSTDKAFYQREMANPERRKAFVAAAESVCFLGRAVEQCIKLNIGMACCNQQGWIESMKYFQPGHAAVINRDGAMTALIPGRFMAEHIRPDLAMGFVSARS